MVLYYLTFSGLLVDVVALVPTGQYAGCMALTLNYLVLPDHGGTFIFTARSSNQHSEASNRRPCTGVETREENQMTRVCQTVQQATPYTLSGCLSRVGSLPGYVTGQTGRQTSGFSPVPGSHLGLKRSGQNKSLIAYRRSSSPPLSPPLSLSGPFLLSFPGDVPTTLTHFCVVPGELCISKSTGQRSASLTSSEKISVRGRETMR